MALVSEEGKRGVRRNHRPITDAGCYYSGACDCNAEVTGPWDFHISLVEVAAFSGLSTATLASEPVLRAREIAALGYRDSLSFGNTSFRLSATTSTLQSDSSKSPCVD